MHIISFPWLAVAVLLTWFLLIGLYDLVRDWADMSWRERAGNLFDCLLWAGATGRVWMEAIGCG